MPKKADLEKEIQFIEYFTEGKFAGNATQSAIAAGWNKDKKPAQMGAYLRKKLSAEIRKKNEERISNTSGTAISVLKDLLLSDQDSVRLNTAKLILELGSFSSQTINLNVDNTHQKSDEELVSELNSLVKAIPSVNTIGTNSLNDLEEDIEQENNNLEKKKQEIVKH